MQRQPFIAAVGLLTIGVCTALTVVAQSPAANMSFFVTSKNPGKGGNLGGLAGADAYCTQLATAAGSRGKTWHAYLSTDKANAKDRIGKGPWFNAKGLQIASSVADLHSANNKLTAESALTETGSSPNYIGGAQPLQHDILTGTNEDGTASALTCSNWTDGADATATLGHADRKGRNEGVNSWNSVHPSQGCSIEKLQPTGGAGLFYCFAE